MMDVCCGEDVPKRLRMSTGLVLCLQSAVSDRRKVTYKYILLLPQHPSSHPPSGNNARLPRSETQTHRLQATYTDQRTARTGKSRQTGPCRLAEILCSVSVVFWYSFTICLYVGVSAVYALAAYAYYVFVGRLCVPMLQRKESARGTVAEGAGLLVGFNVLWLMFIWTYSRVCISQGVEILY
jgi:hypothetical protein